MEVNQPDVFAQPMFSFYSQPVQVHLPPHRGQTSMIWKKIIKCQGPLKELVTYLLSPAFPAYHIHLSSPSKLIHQILASYHHLRAIHSPLTHSGLLPHPVNCHSRSIFGLPMFLGFVFSWVFFNLIRRRLLSTGVPVGVEKFRLTPFHLLGETLDDFSMLNSDNSLERKCMFALLTAREILRSPFRNYDTVQVPMIQYRSPQEKLSVLPSETMIQYRSPLKLAVANNRSDSTTPKPAPLITHTTHYSLKEKWMI